MAPYLQGFSFLPFDDELDPYIQELPILQHVKQMEFASPVTYFVGENGTGKSTLLEALAIAWGFNPEGGTKNFQFANQNTHANLYRYLRMRRNVRERASDGFFLRAESFYNLASNIDELEAEQSGLLHSYGGTSLHKQSHGESFMSLILHRFSGHGLYILDEPEAALSISRQLSLLVAIDQLVKNHSQFIIATHSPILITYPHSEIYEFTKQGVMKKPYQETENFQIMKQFIENPQRMLTYLFDENL